MPQTTYPQTIDLVNRLTGANVDAAAIAMLKAAGTLSDAMKAAKDAWEEQTDWHPYLADSEPSTLNFDPPFTMSAGQPSCSFRLRLPPLLALSSVVANGRTLIRGTDFVVGPQNATATGDPYLWMIFQIPVFGAPGSIAITGQWGKVATLPDDVWDMLLQRAQMTIGPDLSLVISEGTTERKVGDSTRKFAGTGSDGPLDLQMKLWQRRWEAKVELARRKMY